MFVCKSENSNNKKCSRHLLEEDAFDLNPCGFFVVTGDRRHLGLSVLEKHKPQWPKTAFGCNKCTQPLEIVRSELFVR